MNSLPTSHRVPLRKRSLRPRKSKTKKQTVLRANTPPISHSSPSTTHTKKPMRPLTAYHIFFQIEREYIIQTSAGGPSALDDESIHANKSCLRGVPRRYACIKLLPDWYAGPGKRRKRKHRKSHGMIGFLELSRVISGRWATLGATDPETKRYVATIAARELEDYKSETREYKCLTRIMDSPAAPAGVTALAAAAASVGAVISPNASPSPKFRFIDVSPSSLPPMIPRFHQPTQYMPAASADLVLSFAKDFAASTSSADEDEIDYSICSVSNNGHYIPSRGPALSCDKSNMIDPDGTICDPLFELDDGFSLQQSTDKRCVSPVLSGVNVDIIGDGGVFQLLSC